MTTRLKKHLQDIANMGNIINISPVYGGDINSSYKITFSNNKACFIKINLSCRLFMFECEFKALEEIAKSNTIKVPKPLFYGEFEEHSYLILEFLELESSNKTSLSKLGNSLALMHKITHSKFGWHLNNTIGATKQKNDFLDNWVDFFATHRLLSQIKLAKQNRADFRLIKRVNNLLDNLSSFLPSKPMSSLLHGDLWGGNIARVGNVPVIYDVASYYGDRETDIAMSELFGGFGAEFYTAYYKVLPQNDGYQKRKTIYNLYHILNHYNLFGGGYDIQALSMVDEVLS